MMTTKSCSLGLIAVLCALAAHGVAQNALPLSVFPLTERVELAPGDATSSAFTIRNTTDEPVTLKVELRDFSFDENGGIVELDPGSLGDQSLCPHIDYYPSLITLGPGETSEVRYDIVLPADATGPHWAALIVAPEEGVESQGEEGEFAFRVELRSLYFFTIIQNPLNASPPAGQVMGMDVRGAEAEDGSREITVAVSFQNLGESVLFSTVRYQIRDPQGDVFATFEAPTEITVFPSMTRTSIHTFTGLDLPPGEYLILGVVDFGGDYLAAGQYLATVNN